MYAHGTGPFQNVGARLRDIQNKTVGSATVRALTLRQVPSTARATIDPAQAFWVMIGDAKVERPQLDSRGPPVEVIPAASVTTAR